MERGDEDSIAVGTVLGDRFEVVGELGRGGVGSVYEVLHTVTRHRRALKLLHPRFAKDRPIVDRFLREASAAGRIGHPGIVETIDAGRLPDGTPYVLMEMLEGRSLEGEIDRSPGGLDPSRAVELIERAARAIHAAHEAGIVHRDLKPANLFVAKDRLVVLDFGISRFDERHTALDATATDGILGTPAYLAPEQIEAGPRAVDARTDVHALGLILYECLTGERPYAGESWASLFARIIAGRFRPARELRAAVPAAVDAVVTRALATDPASRYPTAESMADALAATAGDRTAKHSEAPAAFDVTVAVASLADARPAADASDRSAAGVIVRSAAGGASDRSDAVTSERSLALEATVDARAPRRTRLSPAWLIAPVLCLLGAFAWWSAGPDTPASGPGPVAASGEPRPPPAPAAPTSAARLPTEVLPVSAAQVGPTSQSSAAPATGSTIPAPSGVTTGGTAPRGSARPSTPPTTAPRPAPSHDLATSREWPGQ